MRVSLFLSGLIVLVSPAACGLGPDLVLGTDPGRTDADRAAGVQPGEDACADTSHGQRGTDSTTGDEGGSAGRQASTDGAGGSKAWLGGAGAVGGGADHADGRGGAHAGEGGEETPGGGGSGGANADEGGSGKPDIEAGASGGTDAGAGASGGPNVGEGGRGEPDIEAGASGGTDAGAGGSDWGLGDAALQDEDTGADGPDGFPLGTCPSRATPAEDNLPFHIAAGGSHSCAWYRDGHAKCWGRNDDGQLGDGTTASTPDPVLVGFGDIAQLALGGRHTCARLRNGTVVCFGANDHGQLGDGTTTSRLAPAPVQGLSEVVDVAAGLDHTCAVLADTTVRCWGRNQEGQLGDGTAATRWPRQIMPLECGPWGTDRLTPVPAVGLSCAKRVVAGNAASCATLHDGRLACWGYLGYAPLCGDLPDGRAYLVHASPVLAACGSGRNKPWPSPTGSPCDVTGVVGAALRPKFYPVAPANEAVGFVFADGTAAYWESSRSVVSPDSAGIATAWPDQSVFASAASIAQIVPYSGSDPTGFCVRRTNGSVSCDEGRDEGRVVFRGSAVPLNPGSCAEDAADVILEMEAGQLTPSSGQPFPHICAIAGNCDVWCWGDNQYGQLGSPATDAGLNPVRVGGLP